MCHAGGRMAGAKNLAKKKTSRPAFGSIHLRFLFSHRR
jgi:hypothetical protein